MVVDVVCGAGFGDDAASWAVLLAIGSAASFSGSLFGIHI